MSSFVIKDTLFTLPSQGKAYSDLTLVTGDSVRVRPFIASDQKTLAGSSGDAHKIYYNILSKVIVEPKGLDFDKLLLSDVNAILFAVRIMTYGPEYGVEHKCPSCGAQSDIRLNLQEVDVTYADGLDDFSFTHQLIIPKGDTISYHLPTLGDEKIAGLAVAGIKKRRGFIENMDVERAFARIASLIDEVNGEKVVFIQKKIDYLNEMPANVYNELVDAISANDTGLSPTVELQCPSCQWIDDARLGINAEFFRPRSKRT